MLMAGSYGVIDRCHWRVRMNDSEGEEGYRAADSPRFAFQRFSIIFKLLGFF